MPMSQHVLSFSSFTNESLRIADLNRRSERRIDLSQVTIAYHWLTEGKLFDACYSLVRTSDSTKYVLKVGKIPSLPVPNYVLGWTDEVCMTVDPTYTDPAFNEDGSCLRFDMQEIMKDFKITDLTDNGEAEFRINGPIKDWPKYLLGIDCNRKSYEKGIGWEGIRYRALSDWLPESLKSKVTTFKNTDELVWSRKLSWNNTY